MKLTPEREAQFRQDALREAPAGFVCLGNGTGECSLDDLLEIDARHIWHDTCNDGELTKNWYGACENLVFYIKTEKWNELFKPNKSTIMSTSIKEQIKYAETFIGKTILSADGGISGKVSSIEVLTNVDSLDYYSATVKRIRDLIEEQGVFIAIKGKWNPSGDMKYWAHPTLSPIKLQEKVININGYQSIDNGDMVVFGCAKIDKGLLIAAQKFLSSNQDQRLGNRSIQSVKIGAGDFTLKDLNKLLG